MGVSFKLQKKQNTVQICQYSTSKSASSTTSTSSHAIPTNQSLNSELPSLKLPESELMYKNSSSAENALCQWTWNPSKDGLVLKIWPKAVPPTGLIKSPSWIKLLIQKIKLYNEHP